MKFLIIIVAFLLFTMQLRAQYVYTIKADSVKITNCDSAELILENHTQNIPGFLFNTGNGRTIFKRGIQSIGNGGYVIGADTLQMPINAWLQGGNAFGATGVLGTMDNNHLDFYTNSLPRMRLSSAGNLLVGTNIDNGNQVQVVNRGGIFINPVMSTPRDFIKIGGMNNLNDGQDVVISASADSGASYYQILTARNGYIGLGYGSPSGFVVGSPPFRILPGAVISISSPGQYYGNTPGPNNCSALVTSVSNTNEWNEFSNYPTGQNYYYFGTVLTGALAGNKRAPLKISGDQLHFLAGAVETEAAMISEAGNFLIGTTTDNGNLLQVNGNSYFNNNVRLAGLTGDSTQTRILVSDTSGNLFYRSASSLAAIDLIRPSLAVNGPITAQRLKLKQTDWADYVFDSTYRLPRLDEVEAYIQKEHHLPGIPSAAAVQKDSLDVGAGQAALLKKIEELTLYTINQDKTLADQQGQIEKQKEQIESQRAEVEAMKARLEKLEKLMQKN